MKPINVWIVLGMSLFFALNVEAAILLANGIQPSGAQQGRSTTTPTTTQPNPQNGPTLYPCVSTLKTGAPTKPRVQQNVIIFIPPEQLDVFSDIFGPSKGKGDAALGIPDDPGLFDISIRNR